MAWPVIFLLAWHGSALIWRTTPVFLAPTMA
jgi:hypothetical protein